MTAQKFNSVWEALEDADAESASMKIRSLMIAIRSYVESTGLIQAKVAKELGIT